LINSYLRELGIMFSQASLLQLWGALNEAGFNAVTAAIKLMQIFIPAPMTSNNISPISSITITPPQNVQLCPVSIVDQSEASNPKKQPHKECKDESMFKLAKRTNY
jgi:hypothetical protein